MMKNKILFLMAFMFIIGGFSGCKKVTTADFDRITYYPTLKILGASSMIVDKGATFVDPGVYAELKGKDVTDQVEVTSNVDSGKSGIYTISYKMTNEDGFLVTVHRTVYVADPTPSPISTGYHTTADGTQRLWLSSGKITPFSGFQILLLQVDPGVFYISDFMGGYYDQHVGYGSNYAMTGYFKVNSDNTITPISSLVSGWGDSMDGMTSGKVDPATGKITYTITYAGLMEFDIIIN